MSLDRTNLQREVPAAPQPTDALPTGRTSTRSDTRLARFIARALPVLPLLVVTGGAGFGQVLYGIDDPGFSPVHWEDGQRLAVAIGVACGLEAIAVYVGWHAHDALLTPGGAATAARLRRASYLIAAVIAAINYSHFAGPGGAPTPAAVAFAGFSASGPWLWGLHTRRVQRVQLTREGQLDASGATFASERWRAFPWRTLMARRWSIDHSVSEPRAAWEGSRDERVKAAAARADARRLAHPSRLGLVADALVRRLEAGTPAALQAGRAEPGGPGGEEQPLPDRRGRIDTDSHTAICDDLQAEARKYGRPFTQDEVKRIWGIGADKAAKARRQLGWAPRAVDQADRAEPVARALERGGGRPVQAVAGG